MRWFHWRKPIAALAVASFLSAPLFASADVGAARSRPYLGIGATAAKEAGVTGVVVSMVSPDSPAGKGGLKKGDRILKAGDQEVKTFQDLAAAVADHEPGDALTLTVQRDGKEQTVSVTLGDAPAQPSSGPKTSAAKPRAYLGAFIQALTPALKDHLDIPADKGVLITQVQAASPAAAAGLAEEDVVTHVGGVAVATAKELTDRLQEAGPGKEVELTVARGKEQLQLKARLQEAPAAALFPDWGRGLPEGFDAFPGQLKPFFSELGRSESLQRKIDELEKRVRELEQKGVK